MAKKQKTDRNAHRNKCSVAEAAVVAVVATTSIVINTQLHANKYLFRKLIFESVSFKIQGVEGPKIRKS